MAGPGGLVGVVFAMVYKGDDLGLMTPHGWGSGRAMTMSMGYRNSPAAHVDGLPEQPGRAHRSLVDPFLSAGRRPVIDVGR